MNTNRLSHVASLIGEPARTAMLLALMDGRALTANELCRAAGITAPTASRHLALLVEAGLVQMWPQGRHRYHRLASEEVAHTIEGLMQLTQLSQLALPQGAPNARPAVATGPRDAALRQARTCYDHIAGRLGVAIASHLADAGAVDLVDGEGLVHVAQLQNELGRLGVEMPASPARQPLCRACMDWSERRLHLSGRVGVSLCQHALAKGWLARAEGNRALRITPPGALAFRDWMGIALWEQVEVADRSLSRR